MNNQEIIICSAIWYKELELKNPELLQIRGNAPYNINKGIVICGWRHHNCLYNMAAITGKKQYEAGEHTDGFLTNKNRFVDREEAAKIALATNQIKELKFSSTKLYSEDIY
jgi:hypothetical protein